MDTKKPHVKVNLIYFLATYTQQCQHNWKDLRRHRVKRNIHTLHLDLLHVLHSNSTSKWHLLTKGGGHPIQSKPFPTRSIWRSRSIVSWSTHKRATSHPISSHLLLYESPTQFLHKCPSSSIPWQLLQNCCDTGICPGSHTKFWGFYYNDDKVLIESSFLPLSLYVAINERIDERREMDHSHEVRPGFSFEFCHI